MPDPCCAVGAHPQAAQIEAELRRGGEGVRELARRYGVGKSIMGRHKKDCLGITGTVPIRPEDMRPLTLEDVGSKRLHRVAPVVAGSALAAPPPDAASTDGGTVAATGVVVVDGAPSAGEAVVAPDGSVQQPPASDGTVSGYAALTSKPWGLERLPKDMNPKACVTMEQRVRFVADLIAQGRYYGRPTAKELSKVWLVKDQVVQQYAAEAARMCRADRGHLEELREAALGHWSRIREQAIRHKDFRGAAAAQAGYDRAAGLISSTSAVSWNILVQHPMVLEYVTAITGAVNELVGGDAEKMAAFASRLQDIALQQQAKPERGRLNSPKLPAHQRIH